MLFYKGACYLQAPLFMRDRKRGTKIMICQNCGTQLPDGTPACPTCGAQFMAQQPYMDPNMPYTAAPAAPAKKSNVGLIVGIVAAVAIVVIAIVLVKLLGGKDEAKSEYDGNYKLASCAMYGMEYSVAEMEEMSLGQSFDMTLTVKGNKCTLDAKSMGYDKASCKIKFDGDTVTLIEGDEEMVGTYNADEKSIVLNSAGVDMKFVLVD